jgi:hypothetical protein
MTRSARIWSIVLTGGAAVAAVLLAAGVAGAFLCRTDLWLIGMRGALTILGVLGLLYSAIIGHAWLAMWRMGQDVTCDRSASALPLPDDLAPAQAELLRLGLVRIGQTETRAANAPRPMVAEIFAAPFESRIVASLSFSRTRTTFASYLFDGRVIETGYPPLGLAKMKVPDGWRLLPEWLNAYECADGVEPALRLHLSCLASEAARGYPALPIPGYQTAIYWENVALARMRSFYRQQLWRKTRSILWIGPACLVFFWMGAFATWR